MKRFLALLLSIFMLADSAAALAATLPSSLTVVEEEAFYNDRSLTGVQQLPPGVEMVGDHAFSGTGLFALDVPATAVSVGTQQLTNAGYVRLRGTETVLAGLSGVRCLIAPAANASAAAIDGVEWVCEEQLVEGEQFFYLLEDAGLKLLLAKDPAQVGSQVTIPALIDDVPVAAVSDYAFMGCTGLKTISLPHTLKGKVPASAFADCAGASVTYYGGAEELSVDSVTAAASAGVVGDSVTWRVSVTSTSGVSSYVYTLTREGKVIATETSSAATFSYVLDEVGAYQLTVRVTDAKGNEATGMSAVLFIAHEAMIMTVPETIAAGSDLKVQVAEVEGAISYSIYVTNEATGELVTTRTLTKPGEATISGYQLDPGVYRLSGYVYGNDFRYAVPSVAMVTVTGEKAEGPVIPEQEPLVGQTSVEIKLSGGESAVFRYWYQYSDGTTSTTWTTTSNPFWCYPNGSYEQWAEGGVIYVQGALKTDGVWTAWGPVREIIVLSCPRLDAPVFTSPSTVEAGTDIILSFDDVEDATYYDLTIWEDYYPDEEIREGSPLYYRNINTAGMITLPGYLFSEGTYTLQLMAFSDEDREPGCYRARLDVTGLQAAAPTVTTDKTEAYYADDTVTLSITAPGAASAVIQVYYIQDSSYADHWFDFTVTLDENGCGSRQLRLSEDSWVLGHTMEYRVSALVDGKWSAVTTIPVLMVDREPIEKATVNLPENITAGKDLSFSFNAVEHANAYEVYLYSAYSGSSLKSWNSSDTLPGTELTFPGYNLTAGSYFVRVEASSDTHGSSTVQVPFTVTGTLPAAPAVTADLAELHIKEKITFTIDTAGADKVAIKYTSNNYNHSMERTPVGDSLTWSFTPNESDMGYLYTFSFSVRRNGVWTAWKPISRTILDVPMLDEVVILVNETYQAGEDIQLSFEEVENAVEYDYDVYDESGTIFHLGGYAANSIVRTMNGYDYEPGRYFVRVIASAPSYRSSTAKVYFEIVGEKPAAPTVSVDKSAAAKGESFTFTIDTTGAEALRYRKRYGTTSSGSYNSSGSITVLDDVTKWKTYSSEAGENEYEFSALVDGLWTAWSAPVAVEIADSSMPKPVVTVSSSHTAGADLTVTVEENTNATSHQIYLYNNRGMQLYSSYQNGSGPVSFTIPGYYLTAGSYKISVTAYGSVGSSATEKNVTVTNAARPDAPEIVTAPEIGRIGNYFTFELNTAGAQKVAVRYYRDGSTGSVSYKTMDATGDLTAYTHSHSTADEVLNFVFAVQVDGVWSPWTSTRQVTITSREQLAQVTLTMPETIEAGENITLSFTGVANADSYTLRLYKPDGNYDSWTAYPDAPRVLEGYSLVAGEYRVAVIANGALYDSSTAQKTFTVTGTQPEAPAVTVDTTEVFTNETFTFAIESAGAEKIRYRIAWANQGGYSNGTLNALADLTMWDTSSGSVGERSYSFCVYRDGKWTAWSTPVSITIKARPALPAVTYTAPTTINQGQNLTVTVNPVEGASYYDVYLYDSQDQYLGGRYMYSSAAGTVEFYGYTLPAGILRIRVMASNSIGGSSEASGIVTVTQSELPAAPTVIAPESPVAVQTRYAFTVSAEGAEKVVVRYYRIGSPNDLNYSVINATNGSVTWSTSQYNSGVTYAYSFAAQINGVWSQWSPFTEITIE